ncbi:MAG: hypothetical protein ACI83B_002336 [Sediminicola sp.]|jgi:hypothetical protein
MKKLLFVFVGVLLLTASKPIDQTKDISIDIATAVGEQKIELTVTGNDESPHYYQPLIVKLKNLTSDEVVINIKNGQLFKSTDPEIQDIIVTQEEMIVLKGFDQISKPIFGMCVQQFNSAPGFAQKYKLDKIAIDNLASIANQIQEKKAFSIAGQNSVWAVTDNNELYAIESYNPEDSNELRAYVADLLNIPDTVIVRRQSVVLDTGPNRIRRTVGGNFKYYFSKTSAVTIGMFNEQNIVVKELYNNAETPAGEHELAYEFDTIIFPEDTYYIRLIIDGQIKINFKMKPRRS